MSDWPRQPPGRGTTLPTGAQDLEFYWEVDATNHVVWHMIYDVGSAKWLFLGGPEMYVETLTSETTTSASYTNLSGGATGPAITVPGVGGGLYMVGLGAELQQATSGANAIMSYDIGGTGAVDADRLNLSVGTSAGTFRNTMARVNRKSIATAVTLTCKYKCSSGTATFLNRWISLRPVQVNPS